jgi:hypothetical protein
MWRRGTAAGLGAVLAATLATAIGAAPAAEPGPIELIVDGVLGAVHSQTSPRSCVALTGGTAGAPETVVPGRSLPDRGNGLRPGDPTPAPAGLPSSVYLRSTKATYNRRYWFVLHGGRIYYKSNAEVTGIRQPWAPLPTPSCLRGRVSGISVDDDEMVALDGNRRVFTMDGALGDPRFFNWTVRWGPPFWTGPGRTIPNGITWSWSVSSPREDVYWTDPAGNRQPIGDEKVSHIWLLRRGGQGLTYMDPWLPDDASYGMCGPKRGRFRSVDMSASGSTVFVMNRFGDMFTRLYDFDKSGPDSLFLRYSYADQRGKPSPAIQLPPEPWARQPKIPGRITSAISVEKVGAGSVHRMLRVEGIRGGVTGFWQKDITQTSSSDWHFVPTHMPLRGTPIPDPRHDTSRRDLGPSADIAYAMPRAGGLAAVIPNFNLFCSPAELEVTVADGSTAHLVLHTVDAIRQRPRARGLDSHPRVLQGTIEAGPDVLHSADREIRAFAAQDLDGTYTDVRVEATRAAIRMPDEGWTFRRAR